MVLKVNRLLIKMFQHADKNVVVGEKIVLNLELNNERLNELTTEKL